MPKPQKFERKYEWRRQIFRNERLLGGVNNCRWKRAAEALAMG